MLSNCWIMNWIYNCKLLIFYSSLHRNARVIEMQAVPVISYYFFAESAFNHSTDLHLLSLISSKTDNNITAKLANQFIWTRLRTFDWQQLFTWHWQWLLLRLLKHHLPLQTTVLFRTTLIWTIRLHCYIEVSFTCIQTKIVFDINLCQHPIFVQLCCSLINSFEKW